MGIVQLETADLFVYNGAGFEPWLDKITGVLENDKIIFVETAKEVSLIEGHAHSHDDDDHDHDHDHEDEHDHDDEDEHEGEVMDPHVWLNPLNAKIQMAAILEALVALDPDHADDYQRNFDAAAAELDAIDLAYKEAVESFATKEIIVAHEAYGYLCDAYGLTQLGIEGLNSESEPTPARMAELTDYAKEKNISVIFFENLASPKVADALAREVGAKTMVLSPIEGLTEEEIAAGKDYFSVMRDNLEALKEALK
jgi:zinc transport system substrate-binding protein